MGLSLDKLVNIWDNHLYFMGLYTVFIVVNDG